MKYYTIEQASERLKIEKKKLGWWFYNRYNPLEVISGTKIEKINGRLLIKETIIEAYENFLSFYITVAEAAADLGWERGVLENWVNHNRKEIRIKKIGGTNYIYKDDIKPLRNLSFDISDCMNTKEIAAELKIHRSTVLDALHKNEIAGGFTVKGHFYAPRGSVEEYKNKYLKNISDLDEYYSIGQAAEILNYSPDSVRTMIRSPKVELTGIKNMRKNSYFLLKSDVHQFNDFINEIPYKYYTVKQIIKKFNLHRCFVNKCLNENLHEQTKWVVLVQQIERVILKSDFEAFFEKFDKYRLEKMTDPHLIFLNVALMIEVPTYLTQTKSLYFEFVNLKQNTSKASKDSQRMKAREYGFLLQYLMKLEKELSYFTDSELKWLLRTTVNTNLKRNLIGFLLYLQEQTSTVFVEKYRISEKQLKPKEKDIYSYDEFISIQQYSKDIEHHIGHALRSRNYAATWLYISLHLTNAWRSSDFLRLPTVDISLIGINDFKWFYEGNRLSSEQSQRIVNQYAYTRLKVSKTGALNRFLINFEMLIPIATMIVICELHRRKKNARHLLTSGRSISTLIKGSLPTFLPYPLQFGSMKMNRSFMTYLFYKATGNTFTQGIALDLVQNSRRHKRNDSTALYVQSVNKDGNISNITVNLCNRGHFGYLYNLLIERSYMLAKKEINDSLNERSLKIQEFKSIFSTPYELEKFGELLKEQFEERESLAIRVSLMTTDEASEILNKVYEDKMPGHTEHTQCFVHPNCIHPTAITCVGCPNMIPKNYLLISVSNELKRRVGILKYTVKSSIACRERAWINKLLILLQEATNTFGIEYTKTFVDYENLLLDIAEAYHNQHGLLK
ncbi:hypothetical protein PPM_3112 [Paenibacillus polymyxa M1]|uniref:hypothetical protein n=1 Tax=Paenibacillus polymyxa TaxID=1406 RepID=UPI00021BBADA|nr:hypothetical protein [Paenibacillus polymyxa]CCC86049.1 hypothetical protein PPM_3112 [Paenibacillus polymyxa M1]